MLVVPQGQHVASAPRADTWSNHAMSSGQDDKAFLQSLAAQIRARYGTVRQLVLQRVGGAPHGLASMDALTPLNVVNAIGDFADSATP